MVNLMCHVLDCLIEILCDIGCLVLLDVVEYYWMLLGNIWCWWMLLDVDMLLCNVGCWWVFMWVLSDVEYYW